MKKNTRNKRSASAARAQPVSPLAWIGLTRVSSLNLLLLILVFLGSGLSVVFMTYQNRFLFNELQQMRNQANELEVQWGQLLIEQSTFGLEGRIERKATQQLQLRVPEVDRIIMVKND